MTTIVDTRQRLLDIGAEQLCEGGYAQATLRTIAAEAGVKAASIYYHFSSKDELFTEVLAKGMDAISEAFDASLVGVSEPVDRFKHAVTAHLHALFAFGPYTAAHVHGFGLAPRSVRAAIIPLRDLYEAKWDGLLHELVDAGVVRADLNVVLVRLHLLASMNSTLEWFKPGSLDELTNVVLTQCWTGLAA